MKIGTSTTETPVMNPDFDAVVSFKPLVWNSYPAQRNIPTGTPARNTLPSICLILFQYSASRHAVATVIRMALKSSSEMSAIALLITTNVVPHMSVTITNNKCALSVRDTLAEYQTTSEE